jgi:ribonuclease P protein subunit POP4
VTPVNVRNILRHELIGLDVEVIGENNPSNKALSGKVIDESRNTLIIQKSDTHKMIIKQNAIFRFKLHDGTLVRVKGATIVGRPEDRVKKKFRRGW